jgi:hypothetical protein
MTGPPPTAVERELERRLIILTSAEEPHRRLPFADTMALAAITISSFLAVLIAQML